MFLDLEISFGVRFGIYISIMAVVQSPLAVLQYNRDDEQSFLVNSKCFHNFNFDLFKMFLFENLPFLVDTLKFNQKE